MHIKILGQDTPVTMPGFSVREDIAKAGIENRGDGNEGRLMRVFAACIGTSTPIGRASAASFHAMRYDVLAYGSHVYDWLRVRGATQIEVIEAGGAILSAILSDLYPRAEEVDEALGNSEAGGNPPPAAVPPAPSIVVSPTGPPSA